MRVVMGTVLLAIAAPAGGVRSCAWQPCGGAHVADEALSVRAVVRTSDGAIGEVRYGAVLEDGLRVGCWADGDVADLDPVADTREWTASFPVAEDCTLVGFRRVGALWTQSEPVRVRPGDVRAELVFDDPVGGVGVAFRRDPWRGEVVVTGVQPGTPADGHLQAGDRILDVDGQPIRAGRWGFVDAVTGEPGTPVSLRVLHRTGDAEVVRLERAIIPLR